MTTPNRITLALAACEGLSDAELAKRGAGGFAAMIERKRAYANAARYYGSILEKLVPLAKAQAQELAAAQASLQTLEQLDAPVTETDAAALLLAEISNASKSGKGV